MIPAKVKTWFILIPQKHIYQHRKRKQVRFQKNTEYIYFVIIIIRFKHCLKKIKSELKILKKTHARHKKKIQTHTDNIQFATRNFLTEKIYLSFDIEILSWK